MITSKERAILRGYSNNLPDIVHIGKDGVNPNVVAQVNDNLLAHELIKIKVQQNAPASAREICDELVSLTQAEPISVVGGKIVLYKRTTKKGFKHYL